MSVPPHMVRWVSLPVMTGSRPQGRLIVLYDVTDERALERLREDMAHTMVHDLRNPLGSIYSALEMTTEGMLGDVQPDQLEVLQIAQRASDAGIGQCHSGREPAGKRAHASGTAGV